MNVRLRGALGLALCAAVRLAAQNPTATLVGVVTDPAGASVAAAEVEVRNSGTNEARKVLTDQRGEFTVPNLAPGIYDVSVAKPGFRALRETGLELQVEQQARMEYRLDLGSLAEKVEVSASAPLVNTENGQKGDVMVAAEIAEMRSTAAISAPSACSRRARWPGCRKADSALLRRSAGREPTTPTC